MKTIQNCWIRSESIFVYTIIKHSFMPYYKIVWNFSFYSNAIEVSFHELEDLKLLTKLAIYYFLRTCFSFCFYKIFYTILHFFDGTIFVFKKFLLLYSKTVWKFMYCFLKLGINYPRSVRKQDLDKQATKFQIASYLLCSSYVYNCRERVLSQAFNSNAEEMFSIAARRKPFKNES